MNKPKRLYTLALKAILVVAGLNTFGSLTRAQDAWPLSVAKGKFVVLKVPGRLVGFEKVSFWSGAIKYGAIIEASKSGLMVGGEDNWRLAGWPLMTQLAVEKVSRQGQFTVVELQGAGFNVNLRFARELANVDTAFSDVAFSGMLEDFKSSEYYQKEVIGKLLPKIFKGKLAVLPTKSKLRILEIFRYVDSAIKTEEYKGDAYLSLDVGGDSEVYNTIRLDQSQRISHSLNRRLLSYLKLVARTIKFADAVDGVKISILVPFKNFVTEAYSEPNYDRVEIYTSMDVIRQFADDELTSDEVIDESILIVKGNRVRLSALKSI